MSDDAIAFRKLHEGIMKELARVPANEQASEPAAAQAPPQGAVETGPSCELNSYLTRIKQAAALLQQKMRHARELEEVVYSLRDRQAELEAGLEEATRRNAELEQNFARRRAELEQNFAAERDRANRAQAILRQTGKRMQEMEQAVADANARADALAAAIDRAFGEVIEPSQDPAIAAA